MNICRSRDQKIAEQEHEREARAAAAASGAATPPLDDVPLLDDDHRRVHRVVRRKVLVIRHARARSPQKPNPLSATAEKSKGDEIRRACASSSSREAGAAVTTNLIPPLRGSRGGGRT